jgi:hypothetical protein
VAKKQLRMSESKSEDKNKKKKPVVQVVHVVKPKEDGQPHYIIIRCCYCGKKHDHGIPKEAAGGVDPQTSWNDEYLMGDRSNHCETCRMLPGGGVHYEYHAGEYTISLREWMAEGRPIVEERRGLLSG